MRVDPVTPELLSTILPWWVDRDDGDMSPALLPPVGVCALDADGPCAAAWLYQPRGCRVAILDWLITRPGQSARRSREASRTIFDALADTARAGGASVLFASVMRAGMIREAQAYGFTIAATDCTHLVKPL